MICCSKDMNYKVNTSPTCGLSNVVGAGFYNEAKGDNAQFAEFPSVASIEEGSTKLCSGSLIDENVVITSASCVDGKDASSLKVRLGSWRTNSNNPRPDTEEVIQVNKIILHSSHVKQLEPNVALLVLKSSANLNMYINTACLPSSEQNFEGKSCIVVGWRNGKSASDDLKKSTVNTQSCQGAFGRSLRVPEKSICAQLEQKVEEGASLLCQVEDSQFNYIQAGIALSNPSQLDSTPTVFINTADFRSWVDQTMKNEGMETSSYSYLKSRWYAGAIGVALALGASLFNIFG
jgi:hypothetical protein